jgi:hypothetical protein
MTNNRAKHRKTNQVLEKFSGMSRRRRIWSVALTLGLVASASVAIANQINVSGVEFGAGKVDTPDCLINSRVDFTYSIATGGATSVTGVTITGVSTDCSGQYISLKVINSSDATVDEIIWHPTAGETDTSITLRANGSTTATSNSTSSGVFTAWPQSQTSPEGLQSFATTQIQELQFSIFESSRAATN